MGDSALINPSCMLLCGGGGGGGGEWGVGLCLEETHHYDWALLQ